MCARLGTLLGQSEVSSVSPPKFHRTATACHHRPASLLSVHERPPYAWLLITCLLGTVRESSRTVRVFPRRYCCVKCLSLCSVGVSSVLSVSLRSLSPPSLARDSSLSFSRSSLSRVLSDASCFNVLAVSFLRIEVALYFQLCSYVHRFGCVSS